MVYINIKIITTQENWKIIPMHPQHECSNLGKIRNVSTKRVLGGKNEKGYIRIRMDNGIYSAHRLIASAWIDNPENKPTVDHINKIRNDNRVDNLRWATHAEQAQNKNKPKYNNKRSIWKCDKVTGNKIELYNNINEACIAINKPNGLKNISACALNNTDSAYGFKWEYNIIADLENEEWKLYLSIKKHKYYISNYGNVKNNNRRMYPVDDKGYLAIKIHDKHHYVHVLVGKLFIDNPNKYTQVNHKDGNKKNNIVSNLEWFPQVLNSLHAVSMGLVKSVKKIINYDETGNILKIYDSCAQASKALNVNMSSINKCCKALIRTCGTNKLLFKYLDENDDLVKNKISSIPHKKQYMHDSFIKYLLNKNKNTLSVTIRDKNNKIIEICKDKATASRKYKCNIKTITNHCLGIIKYHVGNYIFSYF